MLHWIDKDDRLAGFDLAFRIYAIANGPADGPEKWIGQPLWDQIRTPEIGDVFRALVGKARTGGTVTVSTRCDSPSVLRFVELTIAPGPDGTVVFRSRLKGARFRPPNAEQPLPDTSPEDLLKMCAWCFRVEHDGWQDIDTAVESLGLLQGESLPTITHGICPDCMAARVDEIHAVPAAA